MIAEHDLDPTEPIPVPRCTRPGNDEHNIRNHIIDLIVNVSFRSLKINNFMTGRDLRLNQLFTKGENVVAMAINHGLFDGQSYDFRKQFAYEFVTKRETVDT